MIDKAKIEKLVDEFISDGDIFLVGINVSTGNKISVLVNKKEGITISECVQVSKHIEGSLDRETEDFELQVSSPGLGEPFQVKEQYEMNIGRKVEVVDKEGDKFVGLLKNISDDSFNIETKKRIKGKKRELIDMPFSFDDVRSVKVLVTFNK